MESIIGKNIVKYRKMNGISQKYLAAKIGISSQGLLKIEKGITSPNAKTIDKIVNTLCITPNQLFGIEEITEDNSDMIKLIKQIEK